MAKIIDINTVSRRAVADLLPWGGQQIIYNRLIEKGEDISLPTIARAFNPEHKMTEKFERVLREAIDYIEEVKARRKITVSEETYAEYSELAKTGS